MIFLRNLVFAAIFVAFFSLTNDASASRPQSNGVVKGEGTYFKITDSDYVDISLQSSEPIKVRLKSVPNMVTLRVEPVSSATSTQVTLGGFQPTTTYYKYEDDYHRLEQFTTDEHGAYTYAQDISKPHLIFIQSKKSTKFIKDDTTGGDCSSIGTWDQITKTCALTQDVNETIQIDNDGITLDGNNHTLTGVNTGSGIFLPERNYVHIKNLIVRGFSDGIGISLSHNITLSGNTIEANFGAGINLYTASSTLIEGNSISTNDGEGIVLYDSYANTISGNTVSNNASDGIVLYDSFANTIQKNTFSDNQYGITFYSSFDNSILDTVIEGHDEAITLYSSLNNQITGNTLEQNTEGMTLYSSSNTSVYRNNFIQNINQATNYTDTATFSQGVPLGGNYWSTFDEPSEGCNDVNIDGFCDTVYVFTGGQDDFPWVARDGWDAVTNQSPTISGLFQLKSDGITPITETNITTESTVDFKATLTDTDNDQVKLQVELKESTELFDGTNLLESGFVASGGSNTIVKDLISEGTYRWRARAVDDKGDVSAWQEFGTAGNVDFEVKVVPLYTQGRSAYPSEALTDSWANRSYAKGSLGNYGCGSTIATCGCALTSAVMVARYYDVTQAQDKDVNPKEMNSWLQTEPLGYQNGSIDWLAVARYSNSRIKYDVAKSGNYLNNYALLDEKLNNNQPVIAKQNSGRGGITREHFMVIDNKLATTYGVKDPAWYNTKTLNDTTNSVDKVRGYENGFDGLRIYKKGDGIAQSSMTFTLGSPAELLITDSQGRKLGRDSNGVSFQEIPESSYFEEGYDDPTGENPPSIHKNKIIQILEPLDGSYQLDVIGTGTGSYGLWSSSYDTAGNAQGQEFHSETAPGYTATYNINFDGANATNTITRPSDEISPEATVSVSSTDQGLDIQGVDDTTVNPTVSFVEQDKETIYQIKDEAGNTTQLVFKKIKQEKRELEAKLKSIQYNNSEIVTFPETELKYKWLVNKKTGELKELEQKIKSKGTFEIKAKYSYKKNETEINIKTEEGKETKQTLSGLVIIKLTTKSGVLNFEY